MLKKKKGRAWLVLFVIAIMALSSVFAWFVMYVFEGENPSLVVRPLPEFLSEGRTFTLEAGDKKRGLRSLRATIDQSGRKAVVFEKDFPYEGLFNKDGIYKHEAEFQIDPTALNLAQGRAVLEVQAFDHSRRGGGDGNRTLLIHNLIVDTIPPSIRAMTRLHYVNQGGTCLVIYQASSDTHKSGVMVNSDHYPGHPVDEENADGLHLCYFAVPHDMDPKAEIMLWAEDEAGNQTVASFYHRIRAKRFRSDRMNITDKFLEQILPYFSFLTFDEQDTSVERYLKINNELRERNHETMRKIQKESSPKQLWEGVWMRLPNAATMARYADHRVYFYSGEPIDEKYHMGVDLASLANSPVPAANHGRVVFAERLGIYGNTVILDHGQRLMSLYGHLSSMSVSRGQDVERGDVIGFTGTTGLAGGDHLHFSVMVNGTHVNPIEWWDAHWIRDNVEEKLSTLDNR
ncbi:MAG: M23 family metallopeptidase [Desulfatiglandales bacterium]